MVSLRFDIGWSVISWSFDIGCTVISWSIASYLVFDLVSDAHYMMSVNISVCYEPDNCTLTETIVLDMMFPKPVCDFDSKDYIIPGNYMSLKYVIMV
jgi:hypothetical protein